MKHSIALLSLGLIISACAGSSKPAPYELRGGKFYGKNAASSEYIDDYEDSDSSKDYVYKGRSGNSSSGSAYQDEPDFSQPKKVYRSSDYDNNNVTSSKLAPPPKYESSATSGATEERTTSKLIDDHIDQYEDEHAGKKSATNVRVPTSRDNLTSFNDEPAAKAKSSDYLDLKSVEQSSAKKSSAQPEEKSISGNYSSERSDKLKGVFPKEKPAFERTETETASDTNAETHEVTSNEEEAPAKKALVNISAKEKPKQLELAEEHIEAKEKPAAKEESEPKVEAKAEAKPEPKKPVKEVALETKEEAYISVPDKAPTAKKPEIKAEVKKAELKKPEEPKQEKLEIVAEKKPETEVKKQDIASIPKMEPASTSGPAKFIKPVDGKIVQEFGPGNDGIRIQAAEGTPVKAAGAGEVVYSGNELQGYGNMIVIKHPNGFLTAYSHLENLPVKKGEKVTQGETIGAVGKTGNVQSPQLHFGVRKGRSAVNPRDYMN